MGPRVQACHLSNPILVAPYAHYAHYAHYAWLVKKRKPEIEKHQLEIISDLIINCCVGIDILIIPETKTTADDCQTQREFKKSQS